jgi:hypothetical protein
MEPQEGELQFCAIDWETGHISDGQSCRIIFARNAAMTAVFPVRVGPSEVGNFDLRGFTTLFRIDGQWSGSAVGMELFLFKGIMLTTGVVSMREFTVLPRLRLTNHNAKMTLTDRFRCEPWLAGDYKMPGPGGLSIRGEAHYFTCTLAGSPLAPAANIGEMDCQFMV